MEKKTVRETVTDELCSLEIKRNARFPFLSGVIRGAGELHFSFNGFITEIRHKNEKFVNLVAEVLSDIYGERPEIMTTGEIVGGERERLFSIALSVEKSADLLEKCRIVKDKYEFVDGLPKDFIEQNGARRAFLRGLYLACGSLRVPEDKTDKKSGGYTLSFNLNSDKVKQDVIELLAREAQIEKDAVKSKKTGNGIYVKNSEAVCNVLTALGSVRGALETYDIIAKRQIMNNVNRARNCDMANIDKTVRAVRVQLEAIKKLEQSGKINDVSEELQQTCRLRKEFPDIGIEELGAQFNPPVGKSCVNHRLRRIIELASETGD